jgi:hypothetical protein
MKQNKHILFFLLCLLPFAVPAQRKTAPTPGARPAQKIVAEVFPMKAGNQWHYTGTIKKYVSNELPDTSFTINWTTTITEVFTVGKYKCAVFENFPFQLPGYGDENSDPVTHILAYDGVKNYYLFYGEEKAEVSSLLKKIPAGSLRKRAENILQTPLSVGKEMQRQDDENPQKGRYVWVVDEIKRADIEGIEFVKPFVLKDPMQYKIGYFTSPDVSIYYFIPGLGITGYEYVHNGTTNEVKVKLVKADLK